jgi:hypothetical protein
MASGAGQPVLGAEPSDVGARRSRGGARRGRVTTNTCSVFQQPQQVKLIGFCEGFHPISSLELRGILLGYF